MGANRSVGEVDVTIGATAYIVRFGNRELARLEKLWKVDGIYAIYTQAIRTGNQRFIEFARMGLSRHHPNLTEEEVSDLLDFRDSETEERPLVLAVTQALYSAIPKAKTQAATTPTEAEAPTTVQ
jgi:hypothetical protein